MQSSFGEQCLTTLDSGIRYLCDLDCLIEASWESYFFCHVVHISHLFLFLMAIENLVSSISNSCTIKVSLLKCTVAFFLSYLGLYNHHHCQILEFSHYPQGNLFRVTPDFLLPSPATLFRFPFF